MPTQKVYRKKNVPLPAVKVYLLKMGNKREPLLGKNLAELKNIVAELGLPAYSAKQIAHWMYEKQVRSVDEMTNLSKTARERLSENYTIGCSEPVDCQRSADGTVKYLYRTAEGNYIETVYIPDGERATLCVSSQVGCKMGCAFCMTGRQGFQAQLCATDILNQFYSLPERDSLTNIVFMGQGEPFDNVENVLRTIELLTAGYAYAWSPKRITVSTVGIRKGLVRFLDTVSCHLAISLHHPIPAERARMMPAERAFSIEEVVEILKKYDFCRDMRAGERREVSHQRRLSFEYTVFDGVNDSRAHAAAIIDLLKGLDCRINLIRFHPIPDLPLKGVSDERMVAFRDYLTRHGLFATIRASRGQDIFAACGLLSTARQQNEKKQMEAATQKTGI